ncbi:MAG: tRNA lysidine(34) synthetase TilS [Gemmatimonadota bacterium]
MEDGAVVALTLRAAFARELARLRLGPGPALIAVSGGPDSFALLELLAGAGAPAERSFVVVHFDHGISAESGAVAERVRHAARRYGLAVDVGSGGLGPAASETDARTARFAWFRNRLVHHEARYLFLGHTREDQAETILMRVLKGSGPAGLAGMARRRGPFVRPLLRLSRPDLAELAHAAGLEPWHDPANADPRHLRSWLRGAILPALAARFDPVPGLLAAGQRAAIERRAWTALLKSMPALDFRLEDGVASVAADPLREYDSALARTLIYTLARAAGLTVGAKAAGRIQRMIRIAQSGKIVEVSGGLAELAFDRLRLNRRAGHLSLDAATVEVTGQAGRLEWGAWSFRWSLSATPAEVGRDDIGSWLAPGSYRVRAWRAGDRIRPLGGIGQRLVVRCMQDKKVPKTERQAWPVLEQGSEIVWVPGVCRSDVGVPAAGQVAMRIDAGRA